MTDKMAFVMVLGALSEERWRDPGFGPGEIAQAVGISEQRLAQVIAATGHADVDAFIDRYRATALVKALCRQDCVSIAEAALACGFPSLARCYDAIVELTGLTPVRFRQLARSDDMGSPKRGTLECRQAVVPV